MPEPLPILAPMSEHWRLSNERHVLTLAALWRPAARSLVMSCWAVGLAVVIVRSCTSDEAQYQIWRKGREIPGPNATPERPLGDTVTEAKTVADTAHGPPGLAVDCAFLIDGELVPTTRPFNSWSPSHPWQEYGAVVESLGQEWGGRFTRNGKPFPDLGHAQHANWRAYRRAA